MAGVSLNLVVLRSSDVERAARFFGLLGLIFERERHGDEPEHLAGRVGSVVLEIYPQREAADTAGVRLASVDAVVQSVRQSGGTVVAPPRRGPWGYRAVLADPDGRRVEVIEETACG